MKKDLKRGPIKTKIFLTHTHSDHIMGFPFFTPIFIPGTQLDIYGPVTYEEDTLDKIVGDQLRYRYFPVRLEELRPTSSTSSSKRGASTSAMASRSRRNTSTTPSCSRLQVRVRGKGLCTAYDHEMFRNVFDVKPDEPGYDPAAVKEGEIAAREENEKVPAVLPRAPTSSFTTRSTRTRSTSLARSAGATAPSSGPSIPRTGPA